MRKSASAQGTPPVQFGGIIWRRPEDGGRKAGAGAGPAGAILELPGYNWELEDYLPHLPPFWFSVPRL